MRGRKNSRQIGWRSQKRALLRAMLFAAAPMMALPAIADSPTSGSQFLLPPLPLEGSVDVASPGTKLNPFCQPVPDQRSFVPMTGADQYFKLPAVSTIKLASGDSGPGHEGALETTVRLLPAAGKPAVPAPAQPAPASDAKVVPPMVIRSNPMASPVDAPVADVPSVREPNGVKSEPAINVAQVSNQTGAKAAAAVAAAKPSAPASKTVEGPVSFSLDDETLQEMTTTQPRSSLAAVLRGNQPGRNGSGAGKSVSSAHGYAPVKVEDLRGNAPIRELDQTASITRGNGSNRTLLVPLNSSGDSRPVSATRETDARIVKGARPRVEVGVLPVQIERGAHSGPIVSSPIAELIQEPKPKLESETTFDSPDLVTLDMKRTEVRALKIDGEIRKVQVGDSSICAALAAGPSQLQLIGARDGVTRLAVWTASSDGKEQKSVYQVRVGETVTDNPNDPVRMSNTLTRTAKSAFPESNITVRPEQGKLIVEGTCSDQESAKQVLRMIRSACLLPVIDKLSIR
jgi:hypothetical protein